MYSIRLIKYIPKAHSALIDNYKNAPRNSVAISTECNVLQSAHDSTQDSKVDLE